MMNKTYANKLVGDWFDDAQYNLLMEQKSIVSSVKNWGIDLS